MTRYEHLPFYRKTLELAVYLEQIMRNFRWHNNSVLGDMPLEGAVCVGFPAWMRELYLKKMLSVGVSVKALELQGTGRLLPIAVLT